MGSRLEEDCFISMSFIPGSFLYAGPTGKEGILFTLKEFISW